MLKGTHTVLAAAVLTTASSVQAAVIDLSDYMLAPNGQNLTTTFQHTDISTPNGGAVLPATNGTVVYVVSTFTFGASSDAHLQWQFSTSATAANRIGVEIQDDGLVQTLGSGNGILQNVSPTTPKRTTVDLSPAPTNDITGQTVTLLAKLYFNTAVSSDLGARTLALPNGIESTADDTIMNVWINPTDTDVEGDTSSHVAMIGNGDLYSVWNTTGFSYFRQTIQNQLTPINNEASSITNTTILTGTDATFANALAIAVPEPASLALLGLGGLLVGRRRRS